MCSTWYLWVWCSGVQQDEPARCGEMARHHGQAVLLIRGPGQHHHQLHLGLPTPGVAWHGQSHTHIHPYTHMWTGIHIFILPLLEEGLNSLYTQGREGYDGL